MWLWPVWLVDHYRSGRGQISGSGNALDARDGLANMLAGDGRSGNVMRYCCELVSDET